MSHRLGKAHKFTPEEAREAGEKGGRALSRDRTHMAEIGLRGAVSLRRQRAKAKDQNGKEQ
jgi:general stress protein YciG